MLAVTARRPVRSAVASAELRNSLRRGYSSERLRPFDEIPGPTALPGIGTLWRYFTGEYSFDRLHWTGRKKYDQFGPVVRERIVPGVDLLLLFRPEDIRDMYRQEGPYPSRRSHTALEFYRLSRPDLYHTGGLLPTNGPEWHRTRMALQRPLSSPQQVRRFIEQIDAISRHFVDTCVTPAPAPAVDFLGPLAKVFLEFIGVVMLDSRLGALDEAQPSDSCPARLIQAASDTNSRILKTDNGVQLWRRWPTPVYRRLCRAQRHFEDVAIGHIHRKQLQLQQNSATEEDEEAASSTSAAKTLLESYLTSAELDAKDVLAMVCDSLLAGIDTSSFTVSFFLYHVARNPQKQERLGAEIDRLMAGRPPDAPLDWQLLGRFAYLKACLKETFRLNPISIGVGRILPQDSAIAGFSIPKGTVVVTQNQVSCRLAEHFERPDEFVPERWLRGSAEHRADVSPYLVLPFGHGPRTCIARRLAEQNMLVFLVRLLQRYSVSWRGDGDLDCVSQLINRPDRPVLFSFTGR